MSGCPAQRKESEVTTNSCPVQHDKRQQKETEGNVTKAASVFHCLKFTLTG